MSVQPTRHPQPLSRLRRSQGGLAPRQQGDFGQIPPLCAAWPVPAPQSEGHGPWPGQVAQHGLGLVSMEGLSGQASTSRPPQPLSI